MKIMLILAASRNDPLRKKDPFMPLSLAILASCAPEHEYIYVDLLWKNEVDYNEPVDLVGISSRYTAESRAYEIADEFMRRGVPVVLGGPQPSAVPLRAKEHADAVVIGEAEELWPRLLDDHAKGLLRDFYVCSTEKFTAKGRTVFQLKRFPDLAKVPSPIRAPYKKKYVFDTVYSTRGCPVDCDFCSVTGLFGPKYRHRPVKDVAAEINSFKNYYYLLDDTVFGRPGTYGYYRELYRSIVALPRKRYWTGQANLDAASNPEGREVIRLAAEAGLLYAAIGMESVNPETLFASGAMRKMGAKSKNGAIKTMKDNIAFIQSMGIIVSGWFVIGYDGDTIETYYKTLDFCMKTNVIPVIFPIKALPGTRLHERLIKSGKLDDSKALNYKNSMIPDRDVFLTLKKTADAGFSARAILGRTKFFLSNWKDDKIHKAIFSLVLQTKLKGGVDVSRDEFFVE
jgi:radical SAM superfamily enzyme YgiQ (UPF0313 family)